MPELPEAEYMVRRLEQYAPHAAIRRVCILRDSLTEPQGVRHVRRYARGMVTRYARRAKNVLLHLDTGWTVRIQLGMTGHCFWIADPAAAPPHTRVLFLLARGGALAFEDARTFGSVQVHRQDELPELFRAYGPEPLDPAFRWTGLRDAAAGLRQPLKSFLMDQRRIAGLGNIWAAESLFAARLAPQRGVHTLADAEWRALHAAIRRTLRRAIENAFRVTSRPDEFPEADLLRLQVYGRAAQPCRRCRQPVRRQVEAGRATYFCAGCQR
jgi:formamidopyrimidine-DNA glycosylase